MICKKLSAPRVAAFAAAAILSFLFAVVVSSAENLNITSEISEMRNYYVRRGQDCASFEENLACAATGVITYIPVAPYLSEGESVSDRAKNILSLAGFDQETDASAAALLAAAQKEDGSFGSLDDTLFAVAALRAASTVFSSESAVKYVLSCQKEDGSFGDGTAAATGRVLSVINLFSNDTVVASAIEKAVGFMKNDLTDDGVFDDGSSVALSYAVMGLCDVGQTPSSAEWGDLFSALVKFRNEDASYRAFEADAEPSDEATALALCALHALGRMESPVKQLMSDGEFAKFDLSDYAPFLIGYGVCAALAVAFWVFIFVRKRSTRTLAEAKEEMLKNQ